MCGVFNDYCKNIFIANKKQKRITCMFLVQVFISNSDRHEAKREKLGKLQPILGKQLFSTGIE